MNLTHLKPIRVVVSLLFFILIGFLFLDFRHTGIQKLAGEILYLQFAPSLLNFTSAAVLGASGFIFITLITLLFGRIYCSSLCPLGTFQDAVNKLAKRKKETKRFQWRLPHDRLRFSILAVTAVFFAAGSGFLLNLLDPFSAFGRILTNLFRPLVIWANNILASILGQFNLHLLYQMEWLVVAPLSIGISLFLLFLVVYLSAKHGRLYCNTVCPVGALLGLFSKVSLYQISFDPNACNGCKRCESVCKANCIDTKQQAIDFSRCVSCFNCFAACPENGLVYKNQWQKKAPESKSSPEPVSFKNSRRVFLTGSLLWLAGMATGTITQAKQILQIKPSTIPVPVTLPVTPPGSISIQHFTSQCTACHLCISACPSQVLAPSFLEYGVLGMMQPKMDFYTGHCNYECTDCTDVCPSGAIKPLGVETKKLTQLGVAKFIKKNCVVYTDNTDCGACSEHCPTKAVDMVPYLGQDGKELFIPEVNPDICIGCGGCEYACPTEPFKAIYVEGNAVHQLAEKPKEEKLETNQTGEEEFPF